MEKFFLISACTVVSFIFFIIFFIIIESIFSYIYKKGKIYNKFKNINKLFNEKFKKLDPINKYIDYFNNSIPLIYVSKFNDITTTIVFNKNDDETFSSCIFIEKGFELIFNLERRDSDINKIINYCISYKELFNNYINNEEDFDIHDIISTYKNFKLN